MSVLQNKSVMFIGGGNMASALIDGLLVANVPSLDIFVSDKNQNKRDGFAQKGIAAVSPDKAGELIQKSDIVVLAVKPQVMFEVCESIKAHLADKLIISVAAGIGVATLEQMTGSRRVVRVMPNIPAAVGFGASGLYATVGETDKQMATAITKASGIAVWVEKEEDLHSVTATAGSAPAYFFYILEAMIDKAVSMGLAFDDAKKLAAQTMQGAAVMASQDDPAALRAKVTSKGGTTFAAITYLDNANLKEHIGNAMQACYDRSVELGS